MLDILWEILCYVGYIAFGLFMLFMWGFTRQREREEKEILDRAYAENIKNGMSEKNAALLRAGTHIRR